MHSGQLAGVLHQPVYSETQYAIEITGNYYVKTITLLSKIYIFSYTSYAFQSFSSSLWCTAGHFRCNKNNDFNTSVYFCMIKTWWVSRSRSNSLDETEIHRKTNTSFKQSGLYWTTLYIWLYSVVKVRGNAGERHSWAPKNCWWAFPRPPEQLMVRAGWVEPLQLTIGPQIFSEFLSPQIYTLATGYIKWQFYLCIRNFTSSLELHYCQVLTLSDRVNSRLSQYHSRKNNFHSYTMLARKLNSKSTCFWRFTLGLQQTSQERQHLLCSLLENFRRWKLQRIVPYVQTIERLNQTLHRTVILK